MIPMRRIPIQIDEETYERLRKRAFAEGRSIASLVREAIAATTASPRTRSLKEFRFIGSGRTRQRGRTPVSVDHDAALADALTKRRR